MNFRQTKPRNRRRGATAVEMALALPVLFLMLFATYELSRVNMMLNTAEAAAYEGARLGIIPGASVAECEQAALGVLATVGVKNATVTIEPGDLTTESETITLTVSFRYRDNTIIAPFFMAEDAQIIKSCELVRENQ